MPRLSTFLIWCAMLLVASAAQAQVVRPTNTLYVLLRGGAAGYYGDVDGDPDGNPDDAEIQLTAGFKDPGWAAGGELGYLFNENLSFGIAGLFLKDRDLGEIDGVVGADSDQATQVQGIFRYMPFDAARISPFIELGGALVLGNGEELGRNPDTPNDDSRVYGYGPVLGLGFDIALSPQFSVFLAGQSTLVFPDVATDNFDRSAFGFTNDNSDFDVLAHLGGGLKYAFRPPYVAAEIESLECPAQLVAGESGSFMAMTNEDATMPVEYSWQWGDGTTGSGMTASHAFSAPGTYTVTSMVMNQGGEDSESCLVTVVQPEPTLAGCRATPATADPGEQVTINATATDADEIMVDFGDGTTASTLPARHAYAESGEYTVTINVMNSSGEDSCTINVTVEDTFCADITELNPVFFGYGASTLTADARTRLDENIEILRRCPDICVTINAYSDGSEPGDAMRISQNRADAVMAYYVSQGVDADRLQAVGRGVDPAANSKEDPGPGDSRARRADSIPSSCAGFDGGMDMDSDN